jgi:hypothetical protein
LRGTGLLALLGQEVKRREESPCGVTYKRPCHVISAYAYKIHGNMETTRGSSADLTPTLEFYKDF